MGQDERGMSGLLLLILAILLLWALLGCQSIQPVTPSQELKPTVSYRRDIKLNINGESFVGYGVPKKNDSYAISIISPTDTDVLRITSCHRDIFLEVGGNRNFTWSYVPTKGIEDTRSCLVDISSYSKAGKHAFGSIDFENSKDMLPAILKCNGRVSNASTVSICESKSGLTQQLTFPVEVRADPDPSCRTLTTENERDYLYVTPKKECTYFFCAKDGRCHKHTAFGYEDIPLRQ